MSDPRTPSEQPSPWAPWWVYLLVLLGANYVRAGLVDTGDLPTAAVVAIALGQAAVLFVVVTLVWGLVRPVSR